MVRWRRSTRLRSGIGIVLVVAAAGLWTACDRRPEPGQVSRGSVVTSTEAPAAGPSTGTKGRVGSDAASASRPPAFGERLDERRRMVIRQIEAREVRDPNVLRAMRTVPRHAFVPRPYRSEAYADYPLPIGHGQTISQPYIVAFMTEALGLDPNAKVLEIGTGSGYQAAVCAEIAREVYTIEIVPELAESAAQTLKSLGYTNIHVRAGDGFFGWQDQAPFDAIIGTAAAGQIPRPLLDQLKPGGRMLLPCEDADGLQYLTLVTKNDRGELSQNRVLPVRFVPMTGQVQQPQN